MTAWTWITAVSQVATLFAVLVAILQIIGARAAKHRDFENLYVQRYWDLMDGFKRDPWQISSLDDLGQKDQSRIAAYLQLCEDELDLRRNGLISTKTWTLWALGMRSQCRRVAYAEMLARTSKHELTSVRKYLASETDPLVMSWLGKWWTGIGNTPRKPRKNQALGRKNTHSMKEKMAKTPAGDMTAHF